MRTLAKLPRLTTVALLVPLAGGCGDDPEGTENTPGTGGVATGGAVTGGVATTGGAPATGGAPTGGLASGGSPTGGGGMATGGVGTGGTSSGGNGSGGDNTGGNGTGGDGTGGTQGTGSPGCGSSDPLQGGTITVDIDGTSRKYVVDVPSGYDANREYPLIFVWHPLMGSADQIVGGGYNGLQALANNSAIFVAPDGLDGSNHEASGRGWWNVNNSDMKLLQSMLDNLFDNLCVDQERIFSTGFSFGGMMSYTVGFEFDVFRAVAPCSGDMEIIPHEDTYTDPLPIMMYHGTSDNVVSIDRGRAARDRYLTRNGCGTDTQPVSPSPCAEYQGCGAATIWCEFAGGHSPPSEWAQAVWDFFSQF